MIGENNIDERCDIILTAIDLLPDAYSVKHRAIHTMQVDGVGIFIIKKAHSKVFRYAVYVQLKGESNRPPKLIHLSDSIEALKSMVILKYAVVWKEGFDADIILNENL